MLDQGSMGLELTTELLRVRLATHCATQSLIASIIDNTQENDYTRKCLDWILISLLGYTDCEPFCQFNPSQSTLTHSSAVIFPSKFSSPSSCSFLQIALNSSVTCTYRFVPIFQPLMSQIFYKINTHGQDSNNNTTTCHFKINPTTKPCQNILYLL